MAHVMLDLETLGTGSHSVILSIGAVKFDPFQQGDISSKFEMFIDPVSCMRNGLRIDWNTIAWWMDGRQTAPRDVLLKNLKDAHDLATVLGMFRDWLEAENHFVWGNGANFDNVLLANAYRVIGEDPPWKFFNDRCFRTLKNLAPDVEKPRNKMAHSALNDAITQAAHMQSIVNTLGIKSL